MDNKAIHLVPIKFVVASTMKAKLKATAALNDMTLGDLFLNAVLEKYPFLINKSTEESKLQKELEDITADLKRSNELTKKITEESKKEKPKMKANINRLECIKDGKKKKD